MSVLVPSDWLFGFRQGLRRSMPRRCGPTYGSIQVPIHLIRRRAFSGHRHPHDGFMVAALAP